MDMYRQNLELLRSTRAETLRICCGVSQAQSEFARRGRWSVGENLHHLALADDLYRSYFAELIDLQKSGRRAVLRVGFADVNTSIAYIPKPILPLLEIPFTIANMFVPNVIRETMMQVRLVHRRRSAGQAAAAQSRVLRYSMIR